MTLQYVSSFMWVGRRELLTPIDFSVLFIASMQDHSDINVINMNRGGGVGYSAVGGYPRVGRTTHHHMLACGGTAA